MCGSPWLVEVRGFLTTGIVAPRPTEAVAFLEESQCDWSERQNVSGSGSIDPLEQRHSPSVCRTICRSAASGKLDTHFTSRWPPLAGCGGLLGGISKARPSPAPHRSTQLALWSRWRYRGNHVAIEQPRPIGLPQANIQVATHHDRGTSVVGGNRRMPHDERHVAAPPDFVDMEFA